MQLLFKHTVWFCLIGLTLFSSCKNSERASGKRDKELSADAQYAINKVGHSNTSIVDLGQNDEETIIYLSEDARRMNNNEVVVSLDKTEGSKKGALENSGKGNKRVKNLYTAWEKRVQPLVEVGASSTPNARTTYNPERGTQVPVQTSSKASYRGSLPIKEEQFATNCYYGGTAQKYNLVVATLRREAGAKLLARQLETSGESVKIIKNSRGLYYVIIASCATERDLFRKERQVHNKYTTQPRNSLTKKYGTTFDDMWLLLKKD